MMPEHDPRPGRGLSGVEGAEDLASGHADDAVVQMSSRRASSDGSTEHEVPVVDLRPVDTPTVERRSPEVVAVTAPPPAAVEPTLPNPPPRSALSSRVVRIASPALVVLAVAVVLGGVAVLRSSSSQRSAEGWEASARVESERAASVDRVWIAVLGSVAAGVGQPIDTVEALPDLAAAASDAVTPVAPTGAARQELDRSSSSRAAFVDDVEGALDRSGGAPVELGNELDGLQESHRAAIAATDDAIERALELAAQDRDAAVAARALALVVLLLGLVGAAVAAELSRRRLRWGLDHPVRDLHVMVEQVDSEHTPQHVVPRGFPELTWLGVELSHRTAQARSRLSQARRRADWGEQSRRIFEALELAEDEPSTYSVLDRALASVADDRRVELLLAERGSTSLHEVAHNPRAGAPGCPVGSTPACVALRRGQVSVFDSSESINACPQLRGRAYGPCSAACVPVTVAGRPVGVLHMTGEDGAPPTADVVERLVGLATQTGTRFSALRTLESSRHEASTDGLTGLPNRRTLETQVAELFDRDTPFVMVLADLDRFKRLNDNFGHEVGDRALQLFAGVLRDNVRGNDVVARLGGEEFVLVYPNMSVEISLEAIGRVRAALARALEATTLPDFTCSFGIAHSMVGSDGDQVLRVADAGLLRAKDLGGDQAVVADAELAATIFADDAPPRSGRDERL